jgi:hypothetical protein
VFGSEWDKAEATIVARDAKWSSDGSVATYTYVADVQLASGETFRATVHEPTIATDFWAPSIGDPASVLVRRKDRKVKFDKDDDRLSVKAFEKAKKKAFEDARDQPANTPPAAWSPTAGTANAAIPEAVAEKLARLGIDPGAMQVFTADSAQAQAALAAFTHPVAPIAQTPEARLLELKTLQERGLLTAEEYAEQRHRILDEI